MQTVTQKILAPTVTNQGGFQAPIGGRTFLIQSSDAGNVLTVTLADSQGNRYTVQGVGAGFKASPMVGFTSVQITTTADSNVQFITSDGDVDLQLSQVNAIIANPPNAPANVQVQGQGTTSGNPLYVIATGATLTASNVGINNTAANPVPVSLVSEPGAPVAVSGTVNIGNAAGSPVPVQAQPVASAPSDLAAVAVGTTNPATSLLAASATRKAFRVRNAGTGKLALTAAAATTFAAAALVLNPGDMWVETDAPGAAWYAISDSGTTANVQVLA